LFIQEWLGVHARSTVSPYDCKTAILNSAVDHFADSMKGRTMQRSTIV